MSDRTFILGFAGFIVALVIGLFTLFLFQFEKDAERCGPDRQVVRARDAGLFCVDDQGRVWKPK